MTKQKAMDITNEIMSYYELHGGEEYSGEKVTQLEHMVQAAELAEEQGFGEEVVLAAFLHDIGHICELGHGDNEMNGFGIRDHEELGARLTLDHDRLGGLRIAERAHLGHAQQLFAGARAEDGHLGKAELQIVQLDVAHRRCRCRLVASRFALQHGAQGYAPGTVTARDPCRSRVPHAPGPGAGQRRPVPAPGGFGRRRRPSHVS